MGQSCLFFFIGVMWIMPCHFCMSRNIKISATISHTLKNFIFCPFQQVLKLHISQALWILPIIRRIYHQRKITWKMHIFFKIFFSLPEQFFCQIMLPINFKKPEWCHIRPSWLFHWFATVFFFFFFCYSRHPSHTWIREKTARMVTIFA